MNVYGRMGTKICTDELGHMTKMIAIPYMTFLMARSIRENANTGFHGKILA